MPSVTSSLPSWKATELWTELRPSEAQCLQQESASLEDGLRFQPHFKQVHFVSRNQAGPIHDDTERVSRMSE